jgi:hypothetical protein
MDALLMEVGVRVDGCIPGGSHQAEPVPALPKRQQRARRAAAT